MRSSAANVVVTVIWAVLVFASAGCARQADDGLALYLVTDVADPRQVDEVGLGNVLLEAEPLFSEPEIVSYDLVTNRMVLTPEAYQKVMNIFTFPIDVDGIPFVVVISGDRIFHGAFYSPASSLSYSGGLILHPLGEDANTITFDFGYPGPDPSAGTDPRDDPRFEKWARNR